VDLIADSHVPKYAQIADIFRQRIARGVWAKGFRLPANELLALEFGVSRVTIRQAVDLLSRDGVIEAQQGRGTFVTGALKQDRWLRVETTLSDLVDVYRDTSPEIINISEGRTDALLQVLSAATVAGSAAVDNAAAGIQVFGGMGYTFENNMHLYLKRAHVFRHLFAEPTDVLAELLAQDRAQ